MEPLIIKLMRPAHTESQTQCSKRGKAMSEIKTRITPGPWSTDYVKDERGMYSQKVFDKDGDVLAVIDWCGYEVSPVHITSKRGQNAKAIAAVPEMIEALIKAYGLWWYETYDWAYGENMGDPERAREEADNDPHVKQFKAALEKAGVEVG